MFTVCAGFVFGSKCVKFRILCSLKYSIKPRLYGHFLLRFLVRVSPIKGSEGVHHVRMLL